MLSPWLVLIHSFIVFVGENRTPFLLSASAIMMLHAVQCMPSVELSSRCVLSLLWIAFTTACQHFYWCSKWYPHCNFSWLLQSCLSAHLIHSMQLASSTLSAYLEGIASGLSHPLLCHPFIIYLDSSPCNH